MMLSSLDGHIASSEEETDLERLNQGFTNQKDQMDLENQIRNSDAIILGAQSIRVISEFPRWLSRSRTPIPWVIFTKDGAKFLREQKVLPEPLVLVVPSGQLFNLPRGIQRIDVSESTPAKDCILQLQKLSMYKLCLLGGGKINKLFYREELVHELKLTLAPTMKSFAKARPLLEPCEKLIKCHLHEVIQAEHHLYLTYKILY
jgi:riboflavin biosynthesis pyrimidine reductase